MERTPHKGKTLLWLKTPARAESIQVTRRTAEVLERLHRSEDLGARLALVLTELATNVVKHSNSHTIEVELALSSDSITGSVRDTGCGFTPVEPGLPRSDAVGGRGLFVLESLADEWHIDTSAGTCVSFAFTRDGASPTNANPKAAVGAVGATANCPPQPRVVQALS
jgi:anti-sigma regulatory factor (Ser/Thr protein kinase)